jgi:hypothetical protein
MPTLISQKKDATNARMHHKPQSVQYQFNNPDEFLGFKWQHALIAKEFFSFVHSWLTGKKGFTK